MHRFTAGTLSTPGSILLLKGCLSTGERRTSPGCSSISSSLSFWGGRAQFDSLLQPHGPPRGRHPVNSMSSYCLCSHISILTLSCADLPSPLPAWAVAATFFCLVTWSLPDTARSVLLSEPVFFHWMTLHCATKSCLAKISIQSARQFNGY